MSFIHIKKQSKTDSDGQTTERFAVQAMAIQSPQGQKLIPNPSGKEAAVFESFDEAVLAVQRAGFDYIFEGKKVYLSHITPLKQPMKRLTQQSFADLQDAVPILIERLGDREPSVVTQAAFALGQLADEAATEPLVAILGHEDPTVRRSVAEAMARIGPSTLRPLQSAYDLAQGSKDKNAFHIRLTVMQAFQEMAVRQKYISEQLIPQAIDALEDDNWLVRSAAAQVVGLIAANFNEEEDD